jgi:hypothetical protein
MPKELKAKLENIHKDTKGAINLSDANFGDIP